MEADLKPKPGAAEGSGLSKFRLKDALDKGESESDMHLLFCRNVNVDRACYFCISDWLSTVVRKHLYWHAVVAAMPKTHGQAKVEMEQSQVCQTAVLHTYLACLYSLLLL